MGLCLDKEDGLPGGLELEVRRESIWIVDGADPMAAMWCGEAGKIRGVEVTKTFLKLVLEAFKNPRFAKYLEEPDG